jgi:hypothetical protein
MPYLYINSKPPNSKGNSMNIVLDRDSKALTVIADNGNVVKVKAGTTLFYCERKDGGATIWRDGRPANETIRVDKHGIVKSKHVKGVKATAAKPKRKAAPRKRTVKRNK